MLGQMMRRPLLISSIIEHALRFHGDQKIVSRTTGSEALHFYTYRQSADRIKKLAATLLKMGVGEGTRVATLAWNDYRHFEIYFAVSGIGAICHTINPRLSDEHLQYVVGHAEDSILFADISFLDRLNGLKGDLKTINNYIALCDRAELSNATGGDGWEIYEDLIDQSSPCTNWPEFDEDNAAVLCYTSGTTGNPKGVLYSHRSIVLHAISSGLPDIFGLSSRDVVMPVVPMFHVNAWGIPYIAPIVGASLVLPGQYLDAESIEKLLNSQKVTFTAGVPTIWHALFKYLEATTKRIDTVETVVIGGSAVPESMIETFESYGVTVLQAWGMTEMSPLGAIGRLKTGMEHYSPAEKVKILAKQGRGLFGVELKLVDEDGQEQLWNGEDQGELMVRGPWVIDSYFKESRESTLKDGWFPTGDIATIDRQGYLQITDRAKDIIKSGGEWISSIDLENELMACPEVALAAVIGVPHPEWSERPVAFVVVKDGHCISAAEIFAHLKSRVVKWWLPEEIRFVSELPLGATGKVLKRKLRKIYSEEAVAEDAGKVPA